MTHHNVHKAVLPDEEDGPGVYCPSYMGVCVVIMVNGHPMCVGCYHSVDKCLPKDYSAFIFRRDPSANRQADPTHQQ